MTPDASPAVPDDAVDPRAVMRKVYWRIVPLIFVLYIVAYLDRANAGFAKAQMQESLGLSDSVFGWGFGIFFLGYLLLEIPGALLVEHWSARKWFARILITWGLCSIGMALVRTAGQFYGARFLLGLAEAGFFPGVIVYFTHWFPRAERGRAMAGLVFGVPFSLALGVRVSGWLLQADWLGLQGWQWVFIVEGLPAVLLGMAVPFLLTDRPRDARWLTPAERDWLDRTLVAERREAAAAGGTTLGQAMRQPAVWLLALGILAVNTGGYAMVFWLPGALETQLATAGLVPDIRQFTDPKTLAESDPAARDAARAAIDAARKAIDSVVMNWLFPVYICGLVGVWLSGTSSDRTGERKWHCVGAMILAGAALALSATPGLPWPAVVASLCAFGFFAFAWPPPFWVLPTLSLSASAAAVAIGFINMCANIAGFIGSPVIGALKDRGVDNNTCLLLLAQCFVVGGMIIAFVRVRPIPNTLPEDGP
jgi:ACS family tartrate transporter-like MFS transporter